MKKPCRCASVKWIDKQLHSLNICWKLVTGKRVGQRFPSSIWILIHASSHDNDIGCFTTAISALLQLSTKMTKVNNQNDLCLHKLRQSHYYISSFSSVFSRQNHLMSVKILKNCQHCRRLWRGLSLLRLKDKRFKDFDKNWTLRNSSKPLKISFSY